MSEGDDLAEARRFASLCQETMSAFMSATHHSTQSAIADLEVLQTQARHMQARAISRTALLAIDDLTAAKNSNQSAGTLLALNKLVCQYTAGLDEIAPQELFFLNDLEERLEALLAIQEPELAAARGTLKALLPQARSGNERESLRRLMMIRHTSANAASAPHSDNFDVIMPAVTNEALRSARRVKKSVSVSYAADNIQMDADLSVALQTAIISICDGLVERCIEAPLRRQNQGLSGAAHIAITARTSGGVFNILMTCDGPAPNPGMLKDETIAALEIFGAQLSVSGQKGLTRIELSRLPLAERKASPEREIFTPLAEMRA